MLVNHRSAGISKLYKSTKTDGSIEQESVSSFILILTVFTLSLLFTAFLSNQLLKKSFALESQGPWPFTNEIRWNIDSFLW